MIALLKSIIKQLLSMDWGAAQDNVDGALAYLGCAIHDLKISFQDPYITVCEIHSVKLLTPNHGSKYCPMCRLEATRNPNIKRGE
jgi:hypothetical protein